MSTSKSLPRTLDAWVQHLGKLPLPIEQQQHLRLRRILGDSRRTWREIAEAIESSPSFALQVLREANQSSNSLSDPAESIETALSRLGLSRCEALLNQAPALPENDIPLAFKQILLISQHASQQARGLFGARLPSAHKVPVAVLDSGIDRHHPLLPPSVVPTLQPTLRKRPSCAVLTWQVSKVQLLNCFTTPSLYFCRSPWG